MIVTGTSDWHGPFKQGKGSLSTTTGTLRDAAYTYASRFDGAAGAIPEELLATGHAGCFNHALANISDHHDLTVDYVHTSVALTMATDDHGPSIAGIHLTVEAKVRARRRRSSPRSPKEPAHGAPSPKPSRYRSR
ncbi:OsmC family protein [Kribbella koreensis]|uniref:OsmC family protein n=2 Tax=Kribbella koreensis TaxID=57909 RepID=A0ABP4AQE5_9ACTN